MNRITESIAGLRIAKMFGIEANVKRSVLACPFALWGVIKRSADPPPQTLIDSEITSLRAKELALNRQRKLLGLAMSISNYTLPLLVMVVTFGIYSTVQGGKLVCLELFQAASRPIRSAGS